MNLGFLYLYHKDTELARQAFSKSRFIDPENAFSWFGEALASLDNPKDSLDFLTQAYELNGSSHLEINYFYSFYGFMNALKFIRR